MAWAAAGILAMIAVLLVVGPLPVWSTAGDYAEPVVINGTTHNDPRTADRIQAINSARSSLITLVVGTATGLGLIGSLVATIRNLRLTRQSVDLAQRSLELTANRDSEAQALALQGHVTDRYSKAVEQIGNGNSLHVRLGGIYALERVAADSDRDLPTIVEVLSAFIRETKPATNGEAIGVTMWRRRGSRPVRSFASTVRHSRPAA